MINKLALLLVYLLLMPWASSADDHVVPDAYKTVSLYHAVPARLLYSIALTETQKRLSDGSIRPWPWTWNIPGSGHYFNSREEMQHAALSAIQEGVRPHIPARFSTTMTSAARRTGVLAVDIRAYSNMSHHC